MLKDVVITMHSVHGCDLDEPETVDFVTDGSYSMENGTACFSYMETAITGMEGTMTSVTVEPERIIIDRSGQITSRMVFKEGEKYNSLYDTAYGSAALNINTKKIQHDFDEHGGSMMVDYVISIEHAVVLYSRIELKIEEQRKAE
ncbi:MAG: DUF1934 domain-containing protein [Candidatus Limivicinus sp.]|jgi:uncharacterized beta-barrel protein YwiB (DUF1934 family)